MSATWHGGSFRESTRQSMLNFYQRKRQGKENGSYTFLSERWGRLSISSWWPVRTAFGGRKSFIFYLHSLSYCQCCCHFPTYCVYSKFLGSLQKLPLLIIIVINKPGILGNCLQMIAHSNFSLLQKQTNKQTSSCLLITSFVWDTLLKYGLWCIQFSARKV